MQSVVEVLGIEVAADLLARWAAWYAPESQPFLLPADSPLAGIGPSFDPSPAHEARDSFGIYSLPDAVVCRTVAYHEFMSLPRDARSYLVRTQRTLGRSLVPSVRAWPSLRSLGTAAQADGHRFVWWPSLVAGREHEVVVPFVEQGRRPSRHGEVADSVWSDAARLLPGARALAGTFPSASGPNCFGTVMGAAGVGGAASVRMLREPFEEWLSDATRPGGRDDEPGTVLVWRSGAGLVQHAAVTLGDEWALHKPSQGWMSPVKVLTVADVMRSARAHDRRISRRAMR
ncbi:MAG: hypothetical protein ACYDB7_05745 [Mycobacteriales bacterium]